MNKRSKPSIKTKAELVEKLIYSDPVPITDLAIWETTDHVTPDEAARRKFTPCAVGRSWGAPWASAWFRARFALPRSLARRNPVARIETGGEAVAFVRGCPVVGLNKYRDEVPIPKNARPGQRLEILVEAGANDDFGRFAELPKVERAELAAVHEDVRQLAYDLWFLFDALNALDESSARFAEILHVLESATTAFDFDAADIDAEARRVRRLLRPLFARRASASAPNVTLSGHAHIDVIWLWPLAETTRKCARTFSSVLTYMDQFPDFRFSQTQAYLYETTRERYPKLYRRIRQAVRAGKWEPATGMYVEADCNITSGESLVRQVIFGKRFARSEFGHDVQTLVLPDVFGYCTQLPQILRKAGIDSFTTQKLSWNDTNPFPYNSFIWEGLDGSTVIAHFLPGEDYNSQVRPAHLMLTEKRHKEKGLSKPILYQYGYGDGGGGPTTRMIEFGRRARDFEGIPPCRFGFVRDFFRQLRTDAHLLPRWVGELYLEFHRGTLTTQARTKLRNRKCELALRDAELFGAVSLALGGAYGRRALERCWKLTLLNQFHDCLPGSSIRPVYELEEKHHAEVLSTAVGLAQKSADSIARHIDTTGDGVPIVVWNPLSWPRTGPVQVAPPDGLKRAAVVDPRGVSVPVQRLMGGELLFRAAAVPPMGYEVYRLVPRAPRPPATALKVAPDLLENEFLRVRLNRSGELVSVYDKLERREVLRGGVGNELQLYHDHPYVCDAWEVDYRVRAERISLPPADAVRVVERGPVRVAVEVRRSFGRSKITQRIILYAGERQLEFATEADWHESHKLLKVAFPVAVHAPHATYEVQFGCLRRPTHMNTTWDAAQFEVCAHRWVDLSEPTHGVSLLNDSKYGHDVHANVIRLTLLRAPKHPDETADMGAHLFSYALLPHPGDHVRASVTRKGLEFNVPLRRAPVARHRGVLPRSFSFFSVDSPAVVLDTVKKAEADDAIVLRLYEAHGGTVRANLTTPLPVTAAVECDLLERKNVSAPLAPRNGTIRLDFRPFEIKTLRLRLARPGP